MRLPTPVVAVMIAPMHTTVASSAMNSRARVVGISLA